MKEQIAKLEEIIKALKAEDEKREKTLPPNPHLNDAIVRARLMIKSLNQYAASVEAAKPAEAAAKK